MNVNDKYERLSKGINPRKQAIMVHRGLTNSEGAPIVPQRIDPETGGPLLDVFMKATVADAQMNGWALYEPTPAPRNVKTTSRSRTTKKNEVSSEE